MNLEELIALEGRLETVKDWMNGLRMVAAHPIARQAAIHMTVIEAALTALQSESGRVSVPREVADMEARKDAAYLERNQVVAALAKCFPAGRASTAIDGWSEDWHGCVYINLPTGQVSWHYHDSHSHLFDFLPPYKGTWDGHTTQEKYERLAMLSAAPAPAATTGTGEATGNPLLWNVHSMFQQAERDMGWQGQWRDLLAAIEQHLQRIGYGPAAPSPDAPVCGDAGGRQE